MAAVLVGTACHPAIETRGRPYFSELPLGAAATLPVPLDNPVACHRVELGRALFFDPRLSRTGTVSCATCHDSARAFTDGRPTSIGDAGARGTRNAPTLLGRAYGRSHFWDGRTRTLEEQALLPLSNVNELANTHEEIQRRLARDRRYHRAFSAAFGSDGITIERVGLALAGFVRTLTTGDSPVDRLILRQDSAALPLAARRGFDLFRSRGGCVRCHEPPLFTDERFHNTGVAWRDTAYADSGRVTVTGRADDTGAFKTPTLRNVALTAPYMHDGSLSTLEEVVQFYDRGGNPNRHLDPMLRPLKLTADEKTDLIAFLRALTGVSATPAVRRC